MVTLDSENHFVLFNNTYHLLLELQLHIFPANHNFTQLTEAPEIYKSLEAHTHCCSVYSPSLINIFSYPAFIASYTVRKSQLPSAATVTSNCHTPIHPPQSTPDDHISTIH